MIQVVVVSCESHEQPAESAFEKVRREKLIKLDSAARVAEEQEHIEPVENSLTVQIEDSWTYFKLETGKSLDKNDRSILKLKRLPDLSVSTFKKATVLEYENNELRIRLNEFTDSEKEKQEKFKSNMKEDLEQIRFDIDVLKLKYKS